MRQAFQELVTENPMRVEVERFGRRFVSPTASPLANRAMVSLVALVYVSLIAIVAGVKEAISPFVIVGAETLLLTFVGPLMLHGAVAGERERRSWDLLLVAPITKGQILFGKFLSALAAILLITLLGAVPVAILAVKFGLPSFWNLLLATGVSLSFAALIAAFTLFISTRTKRITASLGTTIGALVVTFALLPMAVIATVHSMSNAVADFLFYWHPAWVLMRIAMVGTSNSGYEGGLSASVFGLPHILAYTVAAAILLKASHHALKRGETP